MFNSNPTNEQLIEFHTLLKKKLFLQHLQSCNTKDELKYFIKHKDIDEALHDKFIKYGTKTATNFIIIDIDKNNSTLQSYKKQVNYILKDITPNWITKTQNGFHVGFILEDTIFINNNTHKAQAQELKKVLSILLNADVAGSHRLIGFWRNALEHESVLNTNLHKLQSLLQSVNKLYYESFSLFDDVTTNMSKKSAYTMRQKDITKISWSSIDKKGFIEGNRNNFLFNKVIGLLYNGQITNEHVMTTLQQLNNECLPQNEIERIGKSILKYNITSTNKQQYTHKPGAYFNDMMKLQIHNYKKGNKVLYERQRLGQKITTIKILQKTVQKLIDGYCKTYTNNEKFTNNNIVKNSNISVTTIRRYRNVKKLEGYIKAAAFKQFIMKLIKKQSVIPDKLPHIEIVERVLKTMEFIYKNGEKVLNFKYDDNHKLIFYEKRYDLQLAS